MYASFCSPLWTWMVGTDSDREAVWDRPSDFQDPTTEFVCCSPQNVYTHTHLYVLYILLGKYEISQSLFQTSLILFVSPSSFFYIDLSLPLRALPSFFLFSSSCHMDPATPLKPHSHGLSILSWLLGLLHVTRSHQKRWSWELEMRENMWHSP